ncbi:MULTISPECIES: hypothetical protein [Streptomyces]|uniref:Uncharacterized protein n=2 Tax=Streptomyces TaxID=1883 RepID=A0ABU2RSK8_9ACTN|nr:MULTISPECIES: hypothetical protein [unclassified Streptomyces]MBK3593417.1 hypothetical protein [Streptomyces sp. MBT51]MDT0430543.1 hypothetical protein [Streptomyces sp. DSM 41770]
MGPGFFHSYHLGWTRADALTLLADLEAAGLRIAHPVTGRVLLDSHDPSSPQGTGGTRSVVTREQFLSLSGLERLPAVGVRLWVRPDLDVLMRIRRAGDRAVAVEFGLGGLPVPERERAVRAIRLTVGRASVLCIGFVLDRTGVSTGADWDGLVVAGTALLDGWPDAVAVREDIAARHPQLAALESVDRSPWRVFGSAALSV